MSAVAYILRRPLVARRPTRWDIHARYALRWPDETLTLPTGTWLLALPAPGDESDANSHLPHYRLVDGRVVALDAPLTVSQADLLTDAQALTALTAYRPLEQAIREDWGLCVEQVDATPPFRLIQCPLCSGTAFTTVAFAEVWCDSCHAQFSVRHTAGDPGFVVDCTWRYYQYRAAYYVVPRSDDLLLTMVCKRGGDPLDLSCKTHCHCLETQAAVTDGQDGSLRAGLHACALGDVYDWSFYGSVPVAYRHERQEGHQLIWPDTCFEQEQKGCLEAWPQMAFARMLGMAAAERQRLEEAIRLLARHVPDNHDKVDLINWLQDLAARPSRAPYLPSRSPWPQRRHLQAGEKYLLHRWLLQREKERDWITAVPVWLVVTDIAEDSYSHKWRVVRDNICPHCGRAVTVADMSQSVDAERLWQAPHGYCRETWRIHAWQPTLFDSA